MQLVVYDGSFEGFLSAVFEVYEYKFTDVKLTSEENFQNTIFGSIHRSITQQAKAERVWKGLKQKISHHALRQLYKTFLSEITDIEAAMLSYIRYVLSCNKVIEYDYSHPDVLKISQTAKMVHREKHRMEAFVRFQQTKEGLYYAVISPDFNVLPLIAKHFQTRYADQQWMIYDLRRKYGLYYDLEKVDTVSLSFDEQTANGTDIRSMYSENEELYQKLWQQYFGSVNIAARKNMKLHIQHMPRRYWRFLTEKLP